jgi:hypothetical protein
MSFTHQETTTLPAGYDPKKWAPAAGYYPSLFNTPKVYNPPTNTDFAYIPMPFAHGTLGARLVIGKNGSVFKAITTQSFVDYIWFNTERGVIEIWGAANNIENAVQRLQAHIERIQKQLSQQ